MEVPGESAVRGGFRADGSGEFTFSNVGDVPSQEELDALLRHLHQDPDLYEWKVKSAEFRFSHNDAAWQRDKEDIGQNHTAFTGPTSIRSGKVVMVCEPKRVEEAHDFADLPRVQVLEGPRYRCTTCGTRFDSSRVGSPWCSAKCRDAERSPANDWGITRHVIIPDTQIDPGTPTDHLLWAGQYIAEHCAGHRTRIIVIGDWWNMGSLSSYDKGTKKAEGRRIKDDIDAGNRGFQVFDEALGDDPLWSFHYLPGNHEERIDRHVNAHPNLAGFLSRDNLLTPPRWERHEYLEPVDLDGVIYSHYFYQPNTGKPYGGENIEGRIKQVGHSFVMGHQQGLRMGMHYAAGRRRIGVVAGSFYQHDEDYKGPQGNAHWRGIVLLNNVEDGSADPMPVSMDYLCRRYAGHRLADHVGTVV